MTIYCKDCLHVIDRNKDQSWWKCALTKTIRLTDGSTRYEDCAFVRVTPSACGTQGKWFSPRPELVDQEPPDQYDRPADAESQL